MPRSIISNQSIKTQAIMRAIRRRYDVADLEALNLALLGGSSTEAVLKLCKKVLHNRKKDNA